MYTLRVRAAALATCALLALSATATADNLIVSAPEINLHGASEVVTLAPSGSFTVSIWIEATHSDGCDATSASRATVTLDTAPAGVSMSPAALEFTSCGLANAQSATLTAASNAPATADPSFVRFYVADTDGRYNTDQAQAKFKMAISAVVTIPTPTITRTITGTQGLNGWYVSDVAVSYALDPASHSGWDLSECAALNVVADTTGVASGCIVKTTGGAWLASLAPVTIKRDATVPDVAVNGPTTGGSYYWSFVPTATCTATDATAGISAVPACAVSQTQLLGPGGASASAEDDAGNDGAAGALYTVNGWDSSGFYAPVRMNTINSAKAGSTVPLKFNIFLGAAPALYTSTQDITMGAARVDNAYCGGGATLDPTTLLATATGSTELRWDTTGQQFVFNWKTTGKAGECWLASMNYAPAGAGGNVATINALFMLK